MPSRSPPPSPGQPAPISQQPLSISPSTRNTPRSASAAAALKRLPRLSTSVARGGTSSADSSAAGSPAVHATNGKSLPSALHGSPSTPTDRATKTQSAASCARRVTASDVAASSSTSSCNETIEMDPINPIGHRRRRSSLMSPSATAMPQPGRSGHARGPSVSGQFVMDEPKISEESEATIKGKDGIIRPSADADLSDEDLHDDEETGLTAKERKRKQKKKRRNTLLDQRIARDNISANDQKAADKSVVRRLAVNATLIGLWYFFSLCISLVS